MNCLDENQVQELLEGRVAPEARPALDTHLAECVTCRRLVAGAAPSYGTGEPQHGEEGVTALTPSRPGALIARYVVQSLVGTGGMGVVYAAHDPELDRKVAIKLLRRLDPASASALQARLVREAQAMARLTHPNVVAVYDVGTVDGQVFIVMELVAGTTLRQWLRAAARTPAQVVTVVRRAGEGLAAAHAVGLVHRDVKPDNVLIAEDGRVLVTDFGLARAGEGSPPAPGDAEVFGGPSTMGSPAIPDPGGALRGPLTRTGVLLGTPAYMAPEQIDGIEATARSDLFSFCVMLYEALYGERPFAGSTVAQLRDAIERDQAREPPRGARVPTWMRRVLLRGLSADPARRPPSMRDLLAALARDPAAARRRAAAAALATLLLAAAVTLGYARASGGARLCAGGAERFDRVLAPARLAALEAPAPSPGVAVLVAEAAMRRARLVDTLAQYRSDWARGYQDACEAAHVRGDQSLELLDQRMSCLDERLAGAEQIAALLERADPSIDERLASKSALEPLASCSDRARLLAGPQQPRDPATRARADELSAERARVDALDKAGDYRAALDQAKALLGASRALGLPPVTAQAAFELGVVEGHASQFPDAERDFEEAVFAAEAARDDRLVARARTALAGLAVLAGTSGGPANAGKLLREADAALARVGGDVDLEAKLLDTRANVEEARGHHAEAEALLVKCVETVRGARGLDPLRLGIAENNLGVFLLDRRPAEALEHFDRAIAIEGPLLGEHHPQLLLAKLNRALASSQSQSPGEQIETAQALLADMEAAVVPDHRYVATLTALYAQALMSDPVRRSEAPAVMERALSILTAKLPPDHRERANAEGQLAEMLCENHRFAEAEPHARALLAFAERVSDDDHVDLRVALRLHAQVLLGMHRATEARAEIERAVSLRTGAVEAWPRRVAMEDFTLAQALDETGDHARAIAAARRAEAGYLAAPMDDDERLAAVRAWLAARSRRP